MELAEGTLIAEPPATDLNPRPNLFTLYDAIERGLKISSTFR